VSSGAKRGWIVTVAPYISAGVVWMFSPPTWNIGSTVRTWSDRVSPCMSREAAAFQTIASWVRSAPFGRPVVPEV
jgi:hypothetical protein